MIHPSLSTKVELSMSKEEVGRTLHDLTEGLTAKKIDESTFNEISDLIRYADDMNYFRFSDGNTFIDYQNFMIKYMGGRN